MVNSVEIDIVIIAYVNPLPVPSNDSCDSDLFRCLRYDRFVDRFTRVEMMGDCRMFVIFR